MRERQPKLLNLQLGSVILECKPNIFKPRVRATTDKGYRRCYSSSSVAGSWEIRNIIFRPRIAAQVALLNVSMYHKSNHVLWWGGLCHLVGPKCVPARRLCRTKPPSLAPLAPSWTVTTRNSLLVIVKIYDGLSATALAYETIYGTTAFVDMRMENSGGWKAKA